MWWAASSRLPYSTVDGVAAGLRPIMCLPCSSFLYWPSSDYRVLSWEQMLTSFDSNIWLESTVPPVASELRQVDYQASYGLQSSLHCCCFSHVFRVFHFFTLWARGAGHSILTAGSISFSEYGADVIDSTIAPPRKEVGLRRQNPRANQDIHLSTTSSW